MMKRRAVPPALAPPPTLLALAALCGIETVKVRSSDQLAMENVVCVMLVFDEFIRGLYAYGLYRQGVGKLYKFSCTAPLSSNLSKLIEPVF
jgi:hypothetical protein